MAGLFVAGGWTSEALAAMAELRRVAMAGLRIECYYCVSFRVLVEMLEFIKFADSDGDKHSLSGILYEAVFALMNRPTGHLWHLG